MGAKNTLVGSTFSEWVEKQVEARQLLLGKPSINQSYTNDELRYINGKTSFLRLVSGVNINNTKNPTQKKDKATTRLEDLGLNNIYTNNELAKAFILEGGTTTAIEPDGAPDSFIAKSGIINSLGGDTLSNKAYGFSSDSKYGYSPMPGLISADIKSLNRGSLREASVKIKCWNPQQFDIIDTLFIKLKYGMLLEWGHSIYVDNDGKVKNNDFTLAHTFLNSTSQKEMYEAIEDYREYSQGNYDAILAYVKNFNWSLNPDNSYDIDLKLISIGDVIESLKMNARVDTPKITVDGKSDEEEQKESKNPLIKNANRTLLDQFFAGVLNTTGNEDTSVIGGTLQLIGSIFTGGMISPPAAIGEKSVVIRDNISEIITDPQNKFFEEFSETFKRQFPTEAAVREVVRLEFDEISDGQEEAYYIKLGTLLRFLEQGFIPKNPDTEETMFTINNTFVAEENLIEDDNNDMVAYCYTFPTHMSLDPSVCLIPLPEDNNSLLELLAKDVQQQVQDASEGSLSSEEAAEVVRDNTDVSGAWFSDDAKALVSRFEESSKDSKKFNDNLGRFFRHPEKLNAGFLNHIHVNCAFVSNELTKLLNSSGGGEDDVSINIYDFLKNIMSGIQKALGGINDFEVVYDSDTNHFYIMDNTQIPGLADTDDALSKPPTEFLINLIDIVNGRGSFVKDVNISSEITSKLATEISMAAASGKASVNKTSSRFDWLNYGCTNRMLKIEEITNQDESTSANSTTETPGKEPDYESIVDKYVNTCELFLDYIDAIANLGYDYDDASEYTPALSTIFNLATQKAEKVQTKNPEEEGVQSRGFIPINLGLTIEGLSGPKIYEKIAIPNVFLPSSYKGNIYFVLKGISHTISDGKWETKYDTFAVPFTSNSDTKLGINAPDAPSSTGATDSNFTPSPNTETDDYRALNSGLPHGRPDYPVDGYEFSSGGSYSRAGDGYTLFKENPTPKTQIIIHHTAGHPNPFPNHMKDVNSDWGWSGRTDNVSTNAIIAGDGYTDLLWSDDDGSRYGNNTGAGKNWRTLSIEILALGQCVQQDGGIKSVTSGKFLETHNGNNSGYAKAVDKWGNETPFRGYEYFQAYNDSQITSTINLIEQWINKHNIPFTYNYEVLFPPASGGLFTQAKALWQGGEPGVYTHNTIRNSGKWDVFPQYEFARALRELALKLQSQGKEGCNGDITPYPFTNPGYNPFV